MLRLLLVGADVLQADTTMHGAIQPYVAPAAAAPVGERALVAHKPMRPGLTGDPVADLEAKLKFINDTVPNRGACGRPHTRCALTHHRAQCPTSAEGAPLVLRDALCDCV